MDESEAHASEQDESESKRAVDQAELKSLREKVRELETDLAWSEQMVAIESMRANEAESRAAHASGDSRLDKQVAGFQRSWPQINWQKIVKILSKQIRQEKGGK